MLRPAEECCELQSIGMGSSGGRPPVRVKVPAEAAAVSSLKPGSGMWADGLWAGEVHSTGDGEALCVKVPKFKDNC